MEHGEYRNTTKSYKDFTPSIGSMSKSSTSFSTSSVPLPTCDEEHAFDEMSDSKCEEEFSNAHFNEHYKTDLKILFLDVDGVLNNPHTSWDANHCGIEDQLLKYLKFIVQRTGCKIVLSTSWRLMDDAKSVLLHTLKTRADLNIDDLVIGQTPSLKQRGGHRTHEIAEYLRTNSYRYNVVSWCALDDMSLHKYDAFSRDFMAGHFVRTDKRTGLTPENMVQCVRYLNANDDDYNSYAKVNRERAYY